MHSIGGNQKMFSGSKSQYFYVFPRHPRQKRPWSYDYAFCEGPLRHLYFYVFPRHPRQKRPWTHHYGFCVGVLWRTMSACEQLT